MYLLGFAIGIGIYTVWGYDALFSFYGSKYEVDPKLLKAIAIVESNLNPMAVSVGGDVGLMQINPRANFNNIDGYPPKQINDLFNPGLSVKIASQVLAWNIAHYGYPRGLAVYNNWGARHSAIDGPFPNQSYVDKVRGLYDRRS